MRNITLLIGAGLGLAPALGLASPELRHPQRDASELAAQPQVPPQPTPPLPTKPPPPVPPQPTPPAPTPPQPAPPRPTLAAPTEQNGVEDDRRDSPPRAHSKSNSGELTRDDLSRYAVRDANSANAKEYRGGDTVIIGAGAATLVLAVVLLVVLL